jgi:hypothetical protein
VIGKAGKTAMATLVERTSRYLVPVALPGGKRDAASTADMLIERVSGMPQQLVKTLTWDQGSELAAHAAITLATDVTVYFAHPHSPWERGTNENTVSLGQPGRAGPAGWGRQRGMTPENTGRHVVCLSLDLSPRLPAPACLPSLA